MLAAVEFLGCPLSYEVNGVGDPVVLIQGVGVHGSGWRHQVNDLAKQKRCLTFDNRGIGKSCPAAAAVTVEQMAQDTLAVMDAADIDSAHIVGHSLGGAVAQQIALAAPRRVRSLSLLCTSARGADALCFSPRLIWLGSRSRIGTRRMKRLAFLEIVMPNSYLAAKDRDQLAPELAILFGHDLADGPAIAGQQLSALRKFNPGPRLDALASIPTLVVSASHDPIFPPEYGRKLASVIPGAKFVEIPDASHGVIIQCAPEINEMLLAHFASAQA